MFKHEIQTDSGIFIYLQITFNHERTGNYTACLSVCINSAIHVTAFLVGGRGREKHEK